MADPTILAAAAVGASGFLGFKGNMAAAKAARQTAEYNAQVQENEAILLQRAKIAEENQLRKKRTKVCMCCDHFRYACTVQCVTLLTCPVHQKLIPQGDHLIKGCKYWVKRRELREGWCPEVA